LEISPFAYRTSSNKLSIESDAQTNYMDETLQGVNFRWEIVKWPTLQTKWKKSAELRKPLNILMWKWLIFSAILSEFCSAKNCNAVHIQCLPRSKHSHCLQALFNTVIAGPQKIWTYWTWFRFSG